MFDEIKGNYVKELSRAIDIECNRILDAGVFNGHTKNTLTYLVGIKEYLADKQAVTFDDIQRDVLKPDEIPRLHYADKTSFAKRGGDKKLREALEASCEETDAEGDKRTGCTKAIGVLIFNFEQCQRLQEDRIDEWADAWIKRRKGVAGEENYEQRNRYARWLAEDSYILGHLKEPPSLRKPVYERLVETARTGLEGCIRQKFQSADEHVINGQMRSETSDAAKEMLLPPPQGMAF